MHSRRVATMTRWDGSELRIPRRDRRRPVGTESSAERERCVVRSHAIVASESHESFVWIVREPRVIGWLDGAIQPIGARGGGSTHLHEGSEGRIDES